MVMIQGRLPSSQPIIAGFSQSLILGPLVFILFINDLSLEISNRTVEIYADDTVNTNCMRTVEDHCRDYFLTDKPKLLSRDGRCR